MLLPLSDYRSHLIFFSVASFTLTIDNMELPPFTALPLRKDGPRGNAWGLFGDSDELGMLNLLTPANTAAAAREIIDGTRVSTDWPLNAMARPCFGRLPCEHKIMPKTPRTINDDSLTFNTQGSSQWDGFRHYGYQDSKVFFGGRTTEDILSSGVIGTDGMSLGPDFAGSS